MVLLKPWVSQVPVAALVAIMVMVSASTFDWGSLRTLVRHPRMSSAVMLATVAVTVATDNLAAGVATGVMLSGVFFTFKVARLLHVRAEQGEGGVRVYRIAGQVFFASADMLVDAFDVREIDGAPVHIDVSEAHFWDVTAVAALTKVVERLRKHGSVVDVIGLNQASRDLILRLDAAPV
jgi:SulP family sulfate permease